MRACVISCLLSCLAACGGGEDGVDGSAGGVDGGRVQDGGGSTTEVCEALADPGLCWAVAVDDLYACVPDETGVLSADRSTCTFSDGTVIELGPLPLPTSTSSFLPDLTIRAGDGSVCGVFFERMNTREVTAGGQTASFVQVPGPRLTLQCDGAEVINDEFSNVVDCAFEGVRLPGWSAELDDTSASLTVSATGQGGPLFECMAE